MSAIPTEFNGFGSCGCDHWRDARTLWILGWIALALVFAAVIVVWRLRARRRAAAVDGGSMVIAAKRRVDLDDGGSWHRGVLRLDEGSLRWRADGADDGADDGVDGGSSVFDLPSIRSGPAVGASQFPFTVSVIVGRGGDEVRFAVRPGDDVLLMELGRRAAATAPLASAGDQ